MQRLPSRQPAQSGFSLVEVMVALVIGILVLMGVITVYLSGARTSATIEALSRVQESGRFGLYFMSRNIRQAGFRSACQFNTNILLNTASAAYDERLFDIDDALFGWNDAAGDFAASIPDYVRGDVLILKTVANSADVTLAQTNTRTGDVLDTEDANDIEADTILFIGDAKGCDLFQKTNAAGDKRLVKGGAGGTPGNANADWSRSFPVTARIHRLESALYYIGLGVDGQPALKRVTFNTGVASGAEELVNGIEDMQLSYGEDTNNDGSVDVYVTADAVADWSDVLSVRVDLLVSSLAQNVIDEPQVLPEPWDGFVDPGDGRLRRVFSSIVSIRSNLQ